MDKIAGVTLTPLKIIDNIAGNIQHAMKSSDPGYNGFGEAYFSNILPGAVKGWKKHRQMVLNLVVPKGKIHFVMFDGREESTTRGQVMEVELSAQNYQRLTVPPGIWMAFSGIGEDPCLLLNIASIPHDPNESESLPLVNELIDYSPFQ